MRRHEKEESENMRKKTIRKKRRSKRPSLYRMVHGKKIQRIFTMNPGAAGLQETG